MRRVAATAFRPADARKRIMFYVTPGQMVIFDRANGPFVRDSPRGARPRVFARAARIFRRENRGATGSKSADDRVRGKYGLTRREAEDGFIIDREEFSKLIAPGENRSL